MQDRTIAIVPQRTTDINSATHNPNTDRWNNTRPIHIPSSPSSVASLSPPGLGSKPELSPTNLLAESENNSTSSASHLIYPTSNTLPVIPPTTTITTSTINTTQPISITSFPNMNIQMNTHVPSLYNMPIRGSKLAPKTFKGDYHKISVRGSPLCHAFPSRTLLLLLTRLPASDVSSGFRCIFRLLMCLPPPDASSTF